MSSILLLLSLLAPPADGPCAALPLCAPCQAPAPVGNGAAFDAPIDDDDDSDEAASLRRRVERPGADERPLRHSLGFRRDCRAHPSPALTADRGLFYLFCALLL